MPTICASAQDSDFVETSSQYFLCRTCRAPIGLANDNNRLLALCQLVYLASQPGKRHIDSARQVSGRRSAFLWLTHIKQRDGTARCNPALQFVRFDPFWL